MWSEEKSKIARRCGDKHALKSKCTKHVRLGALFEVQTLKHCTRLWREVYFEVKMYKTSGPDHFLKFRCRKIARRCGEKHISKPKC